MKWLGCFLRQQQSTHTKPSVNTPRAWRLAGERHAHHELGKWKKKNKRYKQKQNFPVRCWVFALCCWVSGSSGTYLNVEWNADEDIPTYGDDDSQEISLPEETVNRHKMRWCSTCHATFPKQLIALRPPNPRPPPTPQAATSVSATTAKETCFGVYAAWWRFCVCVCVCELDNLLPWNGLQIFLISCINADILKGMGQNTEPSLALLSLPRYLTPHNFQIQVGTQKTHKKQQQQQKKRHLTSLLTTSYSQKLRI